MRRFSFLGDIGIGLRLWESFPAVPLRFFKREVVGMTNYLQMKTKTAVNSRRRRERVRKFWYQGSLASSIVSSRKIEELHTNRFTTEEFGGGVLKLTHTTTASEAAKIIGATYRKFHAPKGLVLIPIMRQIASKKPVIDPTKALVALARFQKSPQRKTATTGGHK